MAGYVIHLAVGEEYLRIHPGDINDYNDAVDRTNELLKLQKNLKDSLSSKERVYREGIGWVCYMPMINYIG